MLFNSYIFIFCFLPIVFFGYFFLHKIKQEILAKVFLIIASLFFYSWWEIGYLPIILSSVAINFFIGKSLKLNLSSIRKKFILIIGIIFNVGLLGFFKYADFFIDNINAVFSNDIQNLNILLPLAISFFTFQQIAYLVDSYKGEVKTSGFLNYALFVTFFPQLIAGPIVHHQKMIPQFSSDLNYIKKYKNIATGIFIFSIGLFKKVIIADTFSVWASAGFDSAETLNFFEAWAASLSYTFQLYFDFSGYSDMAIGLALLFNIKLPINFDSPYKALNIQDFWRRWHITLSNFLRDYIYIPLGGNRGKLVQTYSNVFIVFLIGGLWHGASWMFVIWGALHGIGMILFNLWHRIGFKLPKILAWIVTFNFINITWVFFRASDIESATKVLKGMINYEEILLPQRLMNQLGFLKEHGIGFGKWLENINGNFTTVFLIFMALIICVLFENAMKIKLEKNIYKAIGAGILLTISFAMLSKPSEFLYFNF